MSVGRLILAVVGLLAAGTGLLAAVLPHREVVVDAAGRELGSFTCTTPVLDAFDDAGDAVGGWFAYDPSTSVILSGNGWCVREARTRLSWGAVGMVVGALIVAASRPRQLVSPS